MAPTKQPQLVLRRDIPPELFSSFAPLLGIARNCGVGVTGTRGIGKSTLLSLFAWLDAVFHDSALIVIDPIGAIIARFFGFLSCFREADQAPLWQRIRYLNLSGPDYVTPTPIYYRTGIGRESAFSVSQRFPDCIARLDPKLRSAGVQGFNPLWEASTAAGQILFTLGCQVTEMADLLRAPEAWSGRLAEALRRDPAIADAVDFFRYQYPKWAQNPRDNRADALFTKLRLFTDDVMKAQFGAATPGIDWREVVEKRLKVFIDVSAEHDYQTRQFKMLWIFSSLMDFFRRFGPVYGATRQHPTSLIVDEITFMTAAAKVGDNPLVDDLDELINRLSRNFDIRIVASFQEPYQIEDEKLLKSLLSLATQFFGRMTDPDSARLIADRTVPYQPRLVKQTVVHVSESMMGTTINERDELFSIPEQIELGRQRFDDLNRYEYLVSRTVREGDKPLPLHFFSIAPFSGIVDLRPDAGVVAGAKQELSLRDGRPVGEVVTEIAARRVQVGRAVPGTLARPIEPAAAKRSVRRFGEDDSGAQAGPPRATRRGGPVEEIALTAPSTEASGAGAKQARR
jgi:hypothetical protein